MRILVLFVSAVVILSGCDQFLNTGTGNAEALASEADELTLSDIAFSSGDSASSVTSDFTVPTETTNDAIELSWSSSDQAAVAVDSGGTATVRRPGFLGGSREVTLTATLTLDSDSVTKDFVTTIVALSSITEAALSPYMPAEVGTTDQLGTAVAADGDFIMIGAPNDDGPIDATANVGAVYVLQNVSGEWTYTQTLRPQSNQTHTGFGTAIDIDGSHAVIASGSNRETAFIFEYDGSMWSEAAELTGSDSPGLTFGSAVAIRSGLAVIGAAAADKAYVFTDSAGSWGERAILTAASGGDDDFGGAVAIINGEILVGAWLEDGPGDVSLNAGAVYRFTGSESMWTQDSTILRASDDGPAFTKFGEVMAASEDTLAISGFNGDGVYLFEYNGTTWSEEQKITVTEVTGGENGDNLGASVGIAGDLLVVGMPREDGGDLNPISDAGAAVVYQRNQFGFWDELSVIRATAPSASDWFGESVAVATGVVAVGAFQDDRIDGVGNDEGSGHVFR